jgi:NAD(P)-dependent dehydrogenase (short-subunit alcohol dehydrogenase family)
MTACIVRESRMRLAGKVALVFGAGSSGPGWSNGKACAVVYAREGARVMAADVDAEAARETCEVIRQEGGTCEIMCADVRQSADIASVVARTIELWGQIDVLHNNVGITEMGDPVDATEESWHRVMDVNATSVFLTCKHVLPHMMQKARGAIVNISSTASVQINNYPYFSYYASKSAVNHMTRALAVRYAPHGIRANAILPGVMNTPLIHRQISGQFADVEEMIRTRNAASPMGRMGDAFDVAYAALFLASDEAKYITGVCLPVDGGKSCTGR